MQAAANVRIEQAARTPLRITLTTGAAGLLPYFPESAPACGGRVRRLGSRFRNGAPRRIGDTLVHGRFDRRRRFSGGRNRRASVESADGIRA